MKYIENYLIFLVFLVMSCGELEQPATNQFVVEAFITADQSVTDIKIKQSGDLGVEELLDIPISDATVRLISGDRDALLSFNPGTGKYFLDGGDFLIEQVLDLLPQAEIECQSGDGK